MSRILAIETATKVCSVALIDESVVLGETSLLIPRVHVERLVIMINNLLDDLRWRHSDLDAVAVSNGPGSFTGLRIGLSVAKGIAFALDKKVVAVPTLDAIAYSLRDFNEGNVIVPLLHARAEEFYYTSFQSSGLSLTALGDYRVARVENIVEEFDHHTIFVGEGVQGFSKYEVVKRKFDANSLKNLPASARQVALLASEKFEKGDFADLESSVPLYVKDFVAVKPDVTKRCVPEVLGAAVQSTLASDERK